VILDQALDRLIADKVLKKEAEDKLNYVPSGKLSASILGQPLQWQILKIIGVPPRDVEEYVLRKFMRGNHVEEWLVEHMIGLKERQKFVEYKDCIGYVDAIVDMSEWESKVGTIPHEVKSVSNMKFKQIEKRGEADRSHKLQACFYAIALRSSYYAIDYVASDDYRIKTWIFETDELKEEVERIIDEVYKTLSKGRVPVFKPIEDWHSGKMYNPYPDWKQLSEKEIENKLKVEFSKQYEILKKGVK